MEPGDLFTGAAGYYARYRPRYPEGVFDLVRESFGLDGTGTLLDLGCGTGQAALPLAGRFEAVVAVDVQADMLEEGKRAAARAGIENVTWRLGSAEAAAREVETARLVTIGNAFHWMDRDAVLTALEPVVSPGGGIAIFAGGSISLWSTEAAWAPPVLEVVRRHLGPKRRAGTGHFEQPPERHQAVCRRSAFCDVETHVFPVAHHWSIDELVGALYSTSYCSPAVLGDKREAFEADLRETLARTLPEGRLVHHLEVDAILARRP